MRIRLRKPMEHISLCLLAVICFSFLLSSCKKQNKESKAISKDYIVKGSCGVFVNRIISITCTLNDRKVIA